MAQKKETKTLITLTKVEKKKAGTISKQLFGKSNYSGLYAFFINNYKEKE